MQMLGHLYLNSLLFIERSGPDAVILFVLLEMCLKQTTLAPKIVQ